jgi:EAL domain-containing protein (putative c-di-GMP-specific phosphodiesterase class I)
VLPAQELAAKHRGSIRVGAGRRSITRHVRHALSAVRCALVLDRLKALGLRLALDDFGTGYSSLSYLDRLPIDIVKIDRAFIVRIGTTPASLTIVASIRQLASDLGLTVVAEGVETEFQRREIAALGCEYAQGYLYARPMPADAIPAYLSRGRPHVLQTASA